MNIYESKLFKFSFKMNELMCFTLIKYKILSNNSIHYEEKSNNFFFILRFLLFIIIVTVGRIPRYVLYFNNLFIVRIVFLIATSLTYIYFFNEIITNVRNKRRLATILNEITSITQELQYNGDGYFKAFLVIEYGTILLITIILLHLDYLRGSADDVLGYTLPEIFVLKSIFNKCIIMGMLNKRFTILNKFVSKANAMHFVNLTKLYQKLMQITLEINKLNGTTYLIITMKAFLFIIFNLYKLIILAQNFKKFPTPNVTLSWYLSVVWIPTHTLHIIIFIYFCDGIQANITKFQHILNKRFSGFTVTEDKVYGRIVSIF